DTTLEIGAADAGDHGKGGDQTVMGAEHRVAYELPEVRAQRGGSHYRSARPIVSRPNAMNSPPATRAKSCSGTCLAITPPAASAIASAAIRPSVAPSQRRSGAADSTPASESVATCV